MKRILTIALVGVIAAVAAYIWEFEVAKPKIREAACLPERSDFPQLVAFGLRLWRG